MARITMCDLEFDLALDEKAREKVLGGAYGGFGLLEDTATIIMGPRRVRTEGVGTFLVGDQLMQRFQDVYIEAYEVRGPQYNLSFIGPISTNPVPGHGGI